MGMFEVLGLVKEHNKGQAGRSKFKNNPSDLLGWILRQVIQGLRKTGLGQKVIQTRW